MDNTQQPTDNVFAGASAPPPTPPSSPKQSPSAPPFAPNEPKKALDLAHNIPTPKRIVAILGVNDETETKDLLGKLYGDYKAMLDQIGKNASDRILKPTKRYILLRDKLEGPIPIPDDVDFTNKESLNNATTITLANILGIEEENKEEAIQKELQKSSIDKDIVKEFIKMRILLGIHERMDLEKFKEEQIQAKWEESANYEKYLREISTLPPIDNEILSAVNNGKKLTEEQLKKLESQSKKLGDGLYGYVKDGKPGIIITNINPENIDKAIDHLRNNSKINWTNLRVEKHRDMAEMKCLHLGKRVSFDGKETFLSKTMPKNHEDYAQWIRNINRDPPVVPTPEWQRQKEKTEKRLVQNIIEKDDPEKLARFWEDIITHSDEATQKRIMGTLTKDQKKTLENYCYEEKNSLLENIKATNVKPNNPENFEKLTRYYLRSETIDKAREVLRGPAEKEEEHLRLK